MPCKRAFPAGKEKEKQVMAKAITHTTERSQHSAASWILLVVSVACVDGAGDLRPPSDHR